MFAKCDKNCWKEEMRYFLDKAAAVRAVALALSTALFALPPSLHAGQEIKETVSPAAPAAPPYEAGRGLLTLQGPSGMFINPTSATLPQGKFTLQYCNFYPENNTEIVTHGFMASYGVTDWLEVGGVANIANVPKGRDLGIGGPLIRIRLLRDQEWWPQLSIGFYGKYGVRALESSNVFIAAYKRLPFDEDGFFKSLGIHAGLRAGWFHGGFREDHTVNFYAGAELQLPYRVYLVGEVGTRGYTPAGDDDHTPFAFGAQWRLGMVNITFAGIQTGALDDVSLFYGVGSALPF
jgi:hypothetical protein